MKLWRPLAVIVVATGLVACSKDKNVQPPAELVDIVSTLGVEELWSTSVGGGGEKLRLALGLAEAGGTLYTASRNGEVHALDAANGRTLWKADTKLDLSAGPGAGEGLVVVGTNGGDVVALEIDTGKQRWRRNVGGEVLAAPLVAGDRVIVRAVDGRLRALATSDGQEAWMVEDLVPRLSLRGTAPPVRAGDVVLCGFDSGKLMAVSIAGGEILWQAQVSSPRGRSELERLADMDSAVHVSGDDVYAVGYQGRVAMLALDSGQIWWTRDLSSYRGLALDDDQLYVSTSDGDVAALRRRDGTTVWQQTGLKRRGLSPPAMHAGAVVVGDFDGYLHWIDRGSGRFVARERPGKTRFAAAPAVVGERMYVIDEGGRVTAFRSGDAAER